MRVSSFGRAWSQVASALLASLVAFSVAGGAGAKAPPASTATARYTLKASFTGYVRWEYRYMVDQAAPNVTEENTAWTGTSTPFVLVNRGSISKPSATIRIGGNEGSPLRLAGFLDHVGTATWYSWWSKPPDYRPQECTTRMRELEGNAAARALVTLVSNRLRIEMVGEGSTTFEQGTDSCGFSQDAGACWIRYRGLGSSCLAIPESIGLSTSWWRTPLDPAKVKFGRSFTITIRRSSLIQPDPPVTSYLFRWVLTFTPVKP